MIIWLHALYHLKEGTTMFPNGWPDLIIEKHHTRFFNGEIYKIFLKIICIILIYKKDP